MKKFILKILYYIYRPIISIFVDSEYEKLYYFGIFEAHVDKYPNFYKSLFWCSAWELLVWRWAFDNTVGGTMFSITFATIICTFIFNWLDNWR